MKKFKFTHEKRILVCKIVLLLFAFVFSIAPSTQARNLEVNSRVIVEMLGLDKAEEGVEITAQYSAPGENENSTIKDKTSVKAASLTEAVEALNTSLGRRTELGHCSVVVVGSELDTEVLGTLLTATEVTADVYLTAAKDKAGDLIGDLTDFMKKTGTTDADFIAYSAKRAHVATTTLLKFLSDLGGASKTAFLPVVEMTESSGGSGSEGGGGGGGSESGGSSGESGGGGQSQGGEKDGMKVEKLAVYNADGRAGLLEKDAARGVAWISSPIDSGVVTADVEFGGEKYKDLAGRLLKKKAEIKLDDERNSATVKLSATIRPSGDRFNGIDAQTDPEATDAVKNAFADAIEKELVAAYEDSLALSCDPLFIGMEFFRHAPDRFDTEYELGTTEIEYEVSVILK